VAGVAFTAVVLAACGGGSTGQEADPQTPASPSVSEPSPQGSDAPVDPSPTETQPSGVESSEESGVESGEVTAENPYGLTFTDEGIPEELPVRSGIPEVDDFLGLGTQGFTITDNPSNDTPERDGPIELDAATAEFFNLPLDQAETFPTAQITRLPDELFLTGPVYNRQVGALDDRPVPEEIGRAISDPGTVKPATGYTDEEWIAAAARQLVKGGAAYVIDVPSLAYLCVNSFDYEPADPEESECLALVKVVTLDPAEMN